MKQVTINTMEDLESLPEDEWVFIEEEWKVEAPTHCAKCNTELVEKEFDVDIFNGKVTIHKVKQTYCPSCGDVFNALLTLNKPIPSIVCCNC